MRGGVVLEHRRVDEYVAVENERMHIRRFQFFAAGNPDLAIAEVIHRHDDAAGGPGRLVDAGESVAVARVAGGGRHDVVENVNLSGARGIAGFNDGFDQQRMGGGADFRHARKPDVGLDDDRLAFFDKPAHAAQEVDGFFEQGIRFAVFHGHQIGKGGGRPLPEEEIRFAEDDGAAYKQSQRQAFAEDLPAVEFFGFFHGDRSSPFSGVEKKHAAPLKSSIRAMAPGVKCRIVFPSPEKEPCLCRGGRSCYKSEGRERKGRNSMKKIGGAKAWRR